MRNYIYTLSASIQIAVAMVLHALLAGEVEFETHDGRVIITLSIK